MGLTNRLYESDIFNGLDPIKDRKQILELGDLNWEYQIKPTLYYDNNNELVQSSKKVVLIKRENSLEEVAIRGKDFKCTSANDLYDVFVNLKDELGLELHSLGHTREGKFIYIVSKLHSERESISSELKLEKYLLIYAVNDGNGKTKFAPLLLKNDEIEYQVSTLSRSSDKGRSSGEYIHTCFEISHHFRFDSTEATMMVKDSIEAHLDDFEANMSHLAAICIEKEDVKQFHHSMYARFSIGNEKTVRGYDKVMGDLNSHFETFNDKDKLTKDTLLGLYLSFVFYIDAVKQRKLGLSGRINSINFTHDNVTKRYAYKQIQILAGRLLG